jgi:hypothetical protein
MSRSVSEILRANVFTRINAILGVLLIVHTQLAHNRRRRLR